MRCEHFEAGRCRSCTLLPVPMGARIAQAQARIADLLAPFAMTPAGGPADFPAGAPGIWHSPIVGPETGFRNKAKMVVSGTASQPVLGIRDEAGEGVDLRDCPLYPAPIHRLLEHLPALIRRAQVAPFDVQRRRGDLKHVLVTCGDGGALMVRFVLSSPKSIARIEEHLPSLQAAVPGVEVVFANINPGHTAVLEGPEEIHIAGADFLRVTQGRIPLRVRPQSFLQTNTAVASRLYAQVGAWIDELAEARAGAEPAATAHAAAAPEPLRVWDLFCGVGGFALHCAPPGTASAGAPAAVACAAAAPAGVASAPLAEVPRTAPTGVPRTGATGMRGAAAARPHRAARSVTGVELSDQAIASAAETAAELGLDADFIAADAFAWARAQAERTGPPDVLIVNPPRRGIGEAMAAWIEASGIPDVVYSSCNPATLARDLAAMPSMRVASAQLLDMFPHTAHAEVLTRLVHTAG